MAPQQDGKDVRFGEAAQEPYAWFRIAARDFPYAVRFRVERFHVTVGANDDQMSSHKPIEIGPDAVPADLISGISPWAMHQPMDFRRNYDRSPYGRGRYCGTQHAQGAVAHAPADLIAY